MDNFFGFILTATVGFAAVSIMGALAYTAVRNILRRGK